MKKLISFLLCLAFVLPLLGCHGAISQEPATEPVAGYDLPDNFDTTRRHEITFWAKNDTNMTQVAIYEKTVADFAAATRGVLNAKLK